MKACRLVFAFLVLTIVGADAPPRQWVLVTTPVHRAALEPLCQLRKEQGFHVEVVNTTDLLSADEIRAGNADKLRARVNTLCRHFDGTSFVLLAGSVGGCPGDNDDNVVPALQGSIGRMKGKPTDRGYGCPNGTYVPAVAVGRLPARTAEEAAAMVTKTVDLETDTRPGAWRRRVTVLAGVPAFNPFVDRLVEGLALARLDRIDPSWTGRAIYHNAESRFCVPDSALHARAIDYVQRGQALTLYLGHSAPEGLYAGQARFLDRYDWGRLRIERGAGVFATFGCLGCQLRGRDGEGYGVAAVRDPHGPAAVLGSQGICFAAMVRLAADAFAGSVLSANPPERLGDAWLTLLHGIAAGDVDSLTFALLDRVDGDPAIPQATQRQEHLEMFVLLGDPALRLPGLPTDVAVHVDGPIRSGATLSVEGTLPARLAGAKVVLTLERTPGSVPTDLEALPAEPGAARDRVMLANHDRANHFVLAQAETVTGANSFSAKLTVPVDLPWHEVILRAYAATETADGQGVLRLALER